MQQQDLQDLVEGIWFRASKAILLVNGDATFADDDKRLLQGFVLKNNSEFIRESFLKEISDVSIDALATMVLAGDSGISLEDICEGSDLLFYFFTLNVMSGNSKGRINAVSFRLAHLILFFLIKPKEFDEKYSGLKTSFN